MSTPVDEFSPAFSTAFDADPAPPTGIDVCYPDGADWSCAYDDAEIAALDPAMKARSEALAWSTLSALLGYRLNLCPTVLRPCAKRCSPHTWDAVTVTDNGTFTPYISGDGRWYNGCGCRSDCSCTEICEVILPTPAGGIVEVSLDGVVLDPTAYRVDNGNRLVRQDGECWPYCQDMSVAAGEVGSFVVSYYPFLAPNDLFRYAAGVLAAEYYKACSGKNCRLPQGVSSVSRNGITMEISSGLFPDGATGLREVDPIIRMYNPNGLKVPPRVLSADSRRGRVQTWRA